MDKQKTVKVNALVDDRIAVLISALSDFDNVYTYESCENSTLGAYVCLHYGSPAEPLLMDTVQFADFLAKVLDGINCTVSIEWLTRLTIVLKLNPDAISDVASRLVCHKTAFEYDRHDKALGS